VSTGITQKGTLKGLFRRQEQIKRHTEKGKEKSVESISPMGTSTAYVMHERKKKKSHLDLHVVTTNERVGGRHENKHRGVCQDKH
jgi:hypothetical protein